VQSSNVISYGDWSSLPPHGNTNVSAHVQTEKPITGTRVWTHRDGRKVNGLLIAVGATEIRLVVSGRMFTVQRRELSWKDQRMLQDVPTSDQGSDHINYLHLPGDSISRTWTDERGRQFDGELVATWGNGLMLRKKDRVYLVSPERLSATDRLAVQQALKSETRLANLVR
jgi:hypothetical protein